MKVKVYWLKKVDDSRIGIMPRPRGGDWLEDEILSLRSDAVDIVVSLLEIEEINELGLTDEQFYCEANHIENISFPIPDRGMPHLDGLIVDFAQRLAAKFKEGKSIVIHCRQGIGRSSIIAAATLIVGGLGAEEALSLIEKARGCPIPDTQDQRDWVKRFEQKYRNSTRAA